MTAEGFFEWVRDCANELERLDGQPATAPAPRRAAWATVGNGHAKADPIGAYVAATMDAEACRAEELRRLQKTVDRGRAVAALAGRALGKRAEIILVSYYIDRELSGAIAGELGVSVNTVYRARLRAFAYIDGAGIVRHDGTSAA